MVKRLPAARRLNTAAGVGELSAEMQDRKPESPYEEIERQNQELLKTLQELRAARKN